LIFWTKWQEHNRIFFQKVNSTSTHRNTKRGCKKEEIGFLTLENNTQTRRKNKRTRSTCTKILVFMDILVFLLPSSEQSPYCVAAVFFSSNPDNARSKHKKPGVCPQRIVLPMLSQSSPSSSIIFFILFFLAENRQKKLGPAPAGGWICCFCLFTSSCLSAW